MLKNKGAHEEQKTMNQEEDFFQKRIGTQKKRKALTLSTFVCVCVCVNLQIFFFFKTCPEFNFLSKAGADEKGILACFPPY